MSNILASIHEIDGRIEIDNYKSELNIFITPFSVTHFGFGYMTQAIGINYLYGLILHTIYEYANHSEYIINKWSEQFKGFKNDSIVNSVGDTLFFMIGMFVAKNYNNLYLFIFIFLIIFLFYSPYFQNYLTKRRLEYLKRKDNTIKIKNRIFNLHEYTYNILFTIWVIVSLLIFIKLKISNKSFKF
jgi:hypothetical protein